MQEELLYYIENRGRLDLAQKNGMLLAPSFSGRVGIINQGSTCYLNSLIQCLFYNLQFRTAILQAKPDSAILVALQQLFAQLQLSLSSAVDTKALVTAFGWSRGQVFEQHDVHELFSLLLDALGDASTDLGKQLALLFEGSMTGSDRIAHFHMQIPLDVNNRIGAVGLNTNLHVVNYITSIICFALHNIYNIHF